MVPFSSRIHWGASMNAIETALAAKRKAGRPVVDLTISNPTAAGIDYPDLTIPVAVASTYQPSAAGMLQAREAVSDYYAGQVPPDRLLLTASTSEAYSLVFKLLCDPGHNVLVPRPSYPLFEYLAALDSVEVLQYPLFYHCGWSLDIGAVRQLITPATRAVALVHPNNPTGSYLKRSEYDALVALCRQHSLALVCDEVFSDYSFGADVRRMPSLALSDDVLTFTFSGLSKVSGLPQMKLGWIAVSGPGAGEAMQRLEWVADTYLSVGAPVQQAARQLLELRHAIQPQVRTRTSANLSYLQQACKGTTCQVLEVEGGWCVPVRLLQTRTGEEWALELLERFHVLVQPGYFYDFDTEAFLVLSLLTPEANFRAGVRDILLLDSSS